MTYDVQVKTAEAEENLLTKIKSTFADSTAFTNEIKKEMVANDVKSVNPSEIIADTTASPEIKQSPVSESSADAGDASEEKTDVGGIVGAVLGSLFFVGLVGAGVVVYMRQSKKEELIPAVPTVELFVSTTGGINSFNPLEKLENDP